MNYYRLFYPLYEKAAEEMCLQCKDFIKPHSKILDLGCGPGIIGKKFQEYFKSELIGIDIKNQLIEEIPFQIFDGKNIPFSENTFDIVLISYVLHHALNPENLLREAKRVSKKIVIYEDLSNTFLSKMFCWFHGIIYSKFFGNPYIISLNSEKDWERVFQKNGLSIIYKKRISNFPIQKQLFVLVSK